MVKRNPNFESFKATYLFVDIAARKKAFCAANPTVELISLGIGDATEALTRPTVEGMLSKVEALGTKEGFTGYPDYNGTEKLREQIAQNFYKNLGVTADEIFVSDGSKPDLCRLQLLFDSDTTVAVQDPVYPAYVDGSVIAGKAGDYSSTTGRYTKIRYMPCNPGNSFFPDLSLAKGADLIYFCSPNNPTGAASTREQLTALVDFAKANNAIIIFDSAYSQYISDGNKYPKSIYEISGAKDVAFETSSFSKSLGYTGVRLGWTVCPKSLTYSDGTPVLPDWARIMGTYFNGPSNIAEAGAMRTLEPDGLDAMRTLINFYKENARIIREALLAMGFTCFGGDQSPYVWMQVPNEDSWAAFQAILEKAHVVTTPGEGFGAEGKSFIRFSAFAHREHVEVAVERLKKALPSLKPPVMNGC